MRTDKHANRQESNEKETSKNACTEDDTQIDNKATRKKQVMMLIEKMALKKTAEKRQSRKIEEINKAYKEDNTQKDNKSKT